MLYTLPSFVMGLCNGQHSGFTQQLNILRKFQAFESMIEKLILGET